MNIRDYKAIRTPFVFLDETGSINDRANRYFGLGIIKCMQPFYLDSAIRKIRQQYHYYDEIKWNTISKSKLTFLSAVLDTIQKTPGINFSAVIINKDTLDFQELFDNNPYNAYQDFTEYLLKKAIHKNEILTILADYITTPDSIKFEVDVKHNINAQLERLAIGGVHRVDSKGVTLIQIADLFLGASVYEYKLRDKIIHGSAPKIIVLKQIRRTIGIRHLIAPVNIRRYQLIEYQSIKKGHHPNG